MQLLQLMQLLQIIVKYVTLHYCNTTQPLVSGATAWLMKNQDNAAIGVNAVIADHCKVC